MARLTQAIERAEQALSSLQAVISIPEPSEIERDAAIQRFEFTFEAIWKTGRHFLREVEGIDDNSHKSVIRSCRQAGIFDDMEAHHALEMADDRNLTSHTYDRDLALQIYNRLDQHSLLLAEWLKRIKEKSKAE